MKKIILFVVTAVLLVSPFVAASTMTSSEETYPGGDMPKTTSDFTHTVFIEEGVTTWCPNCPNAAKALYSLYNTSEDPFYFVALVTDKNPIAQNRSWWHYLEYAIPTIFVDGGFSQLVGKSPEYRSYIEGASARTVHPLELITTVTGHGDATLDITVTVKNTGSKPYLGYVRSYVTEIVSRWNDQKGNPFNFGFLDYAIINVIFLAPQQSRTYTMTWDGAANHRGITFPDIVDNNIMVITTVAHWQPHLVAKVESIGTHFAFYVDQTVGASVE